MKYNCTGTHLVNLLLYFFNLQFTCNSSSPSVACTTCSKSISNIRESIQSSATPNEAILRATVTTTINTKYVRAIA